MPTFPRAPGFPSAPGQPNFPPAVPAGGGGFGGGGFGPRSVSFTQKRPSGGMTLDALLARQKDAAARQQEALATPQTTIPGGIGQMITSFTQGLRQSRAEQEEQRGHDVIADVFSKMDPATGATAEQMAAIGEYDPEMMIKLWSDRSSRLQDAAKQEHWEDMLAPEGAKEGQLYQRNTITGEVRTAGGGAGTSVTINPPSAETGAKLGLAQGFLDNYDAIIKSATAGEMTGGGYITGVQFGRGPGGAQYRNLLQGTEALVRLLTGAGMNESEARQRVTQYEPALTDDATTLVSKITGLKQALENVKTGVETRGQETPDEVVAPPADALPAPDDPTGYEVGKSYKFDDGSWGTYKGPGPVNDATNWDYHGK